MSKLVVEVRFHDGRYHGVGEEFPSPARLFQALVAASSVGSAPPTEHDALAWLELQRPPTVALPRFRAGQALTMYVPHNDADAKPVEAIRAKKTQQPHFFDVDIPFVYCWDFDDKDRALAEGVCRAALGLYQFGRGIDQAYARAHVVDDEAGATFFARYPGDVLVPRDGASAKIVSVPEPGSLNSLARRFEETQQRIRQDGDGLLFVQPPKARFARVAYDGAERWLIFELARIDGDGIVAWPLERAFELVRNGRQAARSRLDGAFSSEEGAARLPMHSDPPSAAASARLRVVPLPSRGMEHTNQSIRRVAVGVPTSMVLADAEWVFAALEVGDARLVATQDTDMWDRYCAASARWQTVTPAILTKRRRLEPTTRETKAATERLNEEEEARRAVLQALRQADIKGAAVQIDVQREPWEARGKRAEGFAKDTRFEKERAWHVRIAFAHPVNGPLAIGDGRFAGLGVMAPPQVSPPTRVANDEVIVLRIDAGLAKSASSTGIADAFRRATMARLQESIGNRALPAWVTGHFSNGDVVRDERGRLRLIADLERQRLVALVPRFSMGEKPDYRNELINAVTGFSELKAGGGGRLLLRQVPVEGDDVLFGVGRRWVSATDYLVNRHDKGNDVGLLVHDDVLAECERRGLHRPHVEVLSTSAVKGAGIFARIALTFAVDVTGPILLGRNRMIGGGLFAVEKTR